MRSTVLAYATVLVAAVVTIGCFRLAGVHFELDFLHNRVTEDQQSFPSTGLIISAAAAVAGVYLMAAGRFSQLAGPVIALQVLSATVVTGGGLVLGQGLVAGRAMRMVLIDVGMILAAGLIVMTVKRLRVHGSRAALR
jgi:hypothetical protein